MATTVVKRLTACRAAGTFCAVLTASVFGAVVACAQTQSAFVLQDHVNHDWPRQLVSFPLAFEAGLGRTITSVTADGEPVPFQAPVAELTRHADGTLATVRVYVMTALPAGGKIIFQAALDGALPAFAPPDLRVFRGGDTVTVEAGQAGLRLPLGEFAGADIPGPYAGFRLADGRWTGTSSLLGTPAPESLAARIVERGPVFAEVELRYAYPQERTHVVRCRLIAGEPVALFSETFDAEPGARYDSNIWPSITDAERAAGRHRVRLAFEGFRPDLDALAAFPDRADRYGGPAPSGPLLAVLHPWQPWDRVSTQMLPLHDADAYLGLMTLRAGRWLRPLDNVIRVLREENEVCLEMPISDGARVWGVHFGDPSAGKPCAIDPAYPDAAPLYPHFLNASELRRARIVHGETALDSVKDWILSWEDTVSVPHPVSAFPPGDLQAAHARFREFPEMAEIAGRVIAQWRSQWAHKTAEDFGAPRYGGDLTHSAPHMRGAHPHFYETTLLYLCSGDEEHAHRQFLHARALLDYAIRQTLEGPGYHAWPYGHRHGVMLTTSFAHDASQMADLLLGSPYIDREQKNQLRARLAFLAYLLHDEDYWPRTQELGKGNVDWEIRHAGALGVISAVLAGHPRAGEWQAWASRIADYVVGCLLYPDGTGTGGTGYSGTLLDYILPYMALLKNAGGRNHFLDERLKRTLRWQAGMCPPPDVRFGHAYVPPYGYGTLTGEGRSSRFAVAAAMTARHDPAFSDLMMDTWNRFGRPVQGFLPPGLIDPSLAPAHPVQRRSEHWENFGAVLRAHADSPLETYMCVADFRVGNTGPGELGAFHLYAKGAPLSLVFGVRAYFNPAAWESGLTQNRVLFDRREEPRYAPAIASALAAARWRPEPRVWVSFSNADLFGFGYRFNRLQGRAAVFEGDEQDPGNLELSEPRPWPKGAPSREDVAAGKSRIGEIEDVPPQDWQRRVVLIKDDTPEGRNYFVIRDGITGTLPTEWNLWLMTEETPGIDGHVAAVRGKYGIDLAVFFAEMPEKIVTGAWGPGPGAHREWHRGFERQRLLQLQHPPNRDYLVVLYPHTRNEAPPAFSSFADGYGVRLDWEDRTDRIVLGDWAVAVDSDGLVFAGEAAVAQSGTDGTRLTLLKGDRLGLDGFLLKQGRKIVELVRRSGEGPVTVRATQTPQRRISGEADGAARLLVLHVPPAYTGMRNLRINGDPAPLRPEGHGIYGFQLPDGECRFELVD